MNYNEFAKLPSSEKVTLVTIEANTQFKIWEFEDGIYFRDVQYFVVKCKMNDLALEQVSTIDELSENKWFFDARKMRLYVGRDPEGSEFVCTYKFFFATTPQKLPCDLLNGEVVEWDGRVVKTGALGQSLDDENTGIVTESSSNIELMNQDGFFDDIFDTFIWENQSIEFFSWSPRIPISEKKILFSGIIEKKSFDTSKIVFTTKDFIYQLKGDVKLGVFSEADGQVSSSLIGKPKRRIYGKVKNIQLAGIDCILKGFPLTGTVTATAGSNIITGLTTQFLKELSPGDELLTNLEDGTELKLSVESVDSDGQATLDREIDVNISNTSFTVMPERPWRFKNRRWHLAGHRLSSPEAEIKFVTTSRRFVVGNISEFEADDNLLINGQTASIRRISNNNIVLKNSLFPIPAVGDKFKKAPVSDVYFGSTRLVEGIHWDLENDQEAIVVLKDNAEFMVAPQKSIGVNLVWTNGSRFVTTTATVDLRTVVDVNDWVKRDSVFSPSWFEVLVVEAQRIILRTPYDDPAGTSNGKVKKVSIIGDDALITADCIGGNSLDGKWIYTASDAVKHLVQNDAGFMNVNNSSFAQANSDCPWLLSMAIPESLGGSVPNIRDTISLINKSVYGSLYGNSIQNISYSILNARRPEDLSVIRDDDIISWRATTDQKIVNKVVVNYRPQIDVLSGNQIFNLVEFDSVFVDRNVGIKRTEERTAYIYRQLDAETLAQRVAFYMSLSTCRVSLKSNLSLSLFGINDKIYMELNRLFKRFSGNDRRKIGIVSSIKSDGKSTEIELNDLGNIFNRVAAVAPNDQRHYNESTREDVVRFGFVLDNTTLTPNAESEIDLGSNRVG